MKMIDLIAAAAIIFLFSVLAGRLWNGIADMHEDALGRLQAVNDASIIVSSFREQTATPAGPPVFPVFLPARPRGITGIRQSMITESPDMNLYILTFILLDKECTVLARRSK